MQNYLQTVLSQYQNSPRLIALLGSINSAIDPGVNIADFYSKVWNINTAVGYGLDLWGRIVGVSRSVNMSASKAFGFTTGFYPFTEAPFYNGINAGANFSLTDDAYRRLILVKAMANITGCSIPALNKLITYLFAGRGVCYVTDGLNMTMTYNFLFPLTDVDIAVLIQSGAVPHPTGVSVSFTYTHA
jgi:hypothetical protein